MPTKSRKRRVLNEAQDELAALNFVLKEKRYLTPRHRVPRTPSRVYFYLTSMPDSKFKLQYKLSRPYFRPLHLLCLLKILGSTDGEGRSADFLSVGGHTAESLLAKRCIRALNSLISARIEKTSSFPHCIGFIDGTLFPLLTRPQDHGEDYFSRKASYAINGLVICDDQSRICYENVGWSGSSYDNRVWRNCKVALNKDRYFGHDQYLLGDSAYQTPNVLVPAFKTSADVQLSVKKIQFTKCLAKVRIPIKATIKLIRTCMILHNMAIADPVPDDWIEPEPRIDFDGEDEDEYLAPVAKQQKTGVNF
ncbi:uncharacterized protein PITG_06198 [Phytophthora infestans T30-4]|uniref:DDE Tnp4 domain-containing protein n=1 Tax=Phytophthora infestans (strain T30-4) TaxID=403677 RepID=D0N4B1_PHYIT|nr:uncharacterized protein PITG_06198 [Phytophthora infestans T30-4]EEY69719.1 conserved hypothetical protein [Phytophthora infestans T30-4]|eukprot:XP_002998366.1 conserved hypothetical protein [Phytophthora infestans T30-4]